MLHTCAAANCNIIFIFHFLHCGSGVLLKKAASKFPVNDDNLILSSSIICILHTSLQSGSSYSISDWYFCIKNEPLIVTYPYMFITWEGLQKPHCTPLYSARRCCMGCSPVWGLPRPSMVVTSHPSHMYSCTRHFVCTENKHLYIYVFVPIKYLKLLSMIAGTLTINKHI